MAYITPLVINGLGSGHTHAHTLTHIHTQTHIPLHERKQFQEIRLRVPGLIRKQVAS